MNMINNLFSIFDPSSSYIKINWLIILVPIIIIIKIYKKISRNIKSIKILIIKTILREIKPLISNREKKGKTLIFLSIFLSIRIRNLLAILPFNFTISAHIILSFPIALIIWIRIILFGWINNPKKYNSPFGTEWDSNYFNKFYSPNWNNEKYYSTFNISHSIICKYSSWASIIKIII